MKLSIEAPENEVALPGEVHLHIRFRPVNLFGVVLVLLTHGLLLYFLLSMHTIKKQGDNGGNPLLLLLDQAALAKMAAAETKKSKTKAPPITPHRKAITPPAVATAVAEQAPLVPPPPQAEAPDMMAMLNAARERRRAANEAAAQENEAASQAGRGLTPQQVAEANVRRSMQQAAGREGTNGVFQILSKSTRMGSFAFNGWRPNGNSNWRQVVEVDAGLGGDVELALVRRMIELIRSHYQGDFSWDSRRLGRVINLSARPQDQAGLEAFLMKEFFS
ncbi:MAG: hypothetical protein HYZ65_02785 [Burkholderiales bacterium]|nr:hypothetical protein [Burkholderiales bacterium]